MDLSEAMTVIFTANTHGIICSLYYAQTKIADTLVITAIISDTAPFDQNPPTWHMDMKYVGNNFQANSALTNMRDSLSGAIDACCCFLQVGDEEELIPIFVKNFDIITSPIIMTSMTGESWHADPSTVDIDIRAVIDENNFGLVNHHTVASKEEEPDEKIQNRWDILDL